MTTIFDAFFGEDEKIYKEEFDKTLRSLSDISKEEREYLNEVFANDLKDGLTKYELRDRIAKLRRNYEDVLESDEIEVVKKKLLGKFDD